MNGLVIPKTPIAVDFWKPRQCPHVKLYFLTHMHADHTHGLSSSWNYHKIYCSEVTKKLALFKFGIKEELIVTLPMEQSVVIPLDELGTESVTVTAIDANHCPGAVMFLFEGYFGRILYTGDFRYSDMMLSDPILLNNVGKAKSIDILYLDNTYCDPKCVFPSRAEATSTIIDIIRQYPEHNIVIGVRSIGKEELLEKIALSFNSWIAVDLKRLEFLRICKCADVFITDAESTRFRVVNAPEITELNVNKWKEERPTIAILPTCLFQGTKNPYRRLEGIFVVPYSDHSSFTELIEFVGLVQPKKVVPIVHQHRGIEKGSLNLRTHMSCFDQKLDPEPQKEFCVPPVVQRFMSTTSHCSKSNSALNRQGSSILCKPRRHAKPCGVIFKPTSADLTCSSTNKQEQSKTQFTELKDKTEICSLVPASENGPSTLHCVQTKPCERECKIVTTNSTIEENPSVDDEDIEQLTSAPCSEDLNGDYSGGAVDYLRKNNNLQLEKPSVPKRSPRKDQTSGVVNDEMSRWSQRSPLEATFVDSRDVVTNCQTEPKDKCDDQELTDSISQSSVCGRDIRQLTSAPCSEDLNGDYSGEAVDYSRKNNLQLEKPSVPERSPRKDQTSGIVNDEMSRWSQRSPLEATFVDPRDVVTNCQTEPKDKCDDQELTDSISQSSVCGRDVFEQLTNASCSEDLNDDYSGEAVGYSRKNNLQLEKPSVPKRSPQKDQTSGIVNDEMSRWSQRSPLEATFVDSRNVVMNCQTEPKDKCDDQELTDSISQSSVCGRGQQLACKLGLNAKCSEKASYFQKSSNGLLTEIQSETPPTQCQNRTKENFTNTVSRHSLQLSQGEVARDMEYLSASKFSGETKTKSQEIKACIPRHCVKDFTQRCRTTKKLNSARKTKPRTSVYGAQYHSTMRAVLDALKNPN